MSKKKRPTRKEFKRLESQFDELFALVDKLTEIVTAQADASAVLAAEMPRQIAAEMAGTIAAHERLAAVRDGVQVNH